MYMYILHTYAVFREISLFPVGKRAGWGEGGEGDVDLGGEESGGEVGARCGRGG